MILWSRRRNVGNEVKNKVLVEVEIVVMDVHAVVELLQTHAELISTPLMEL
jgi:hypothetical protein